MRLIATVGLIASIAAASASRSRMRQSGQLTCLTPDSVALHRIANLKHDIVASDSSSILFRNGFGVAGVDTSTIQAVTDTSICTRVTQVVDSAFASPPATTPYLIVLRVGPRYVAYGVSGSSQYFLDTTFALKEVVP